MALFENVYGPYVPFGSRTLRLQTPTLKGTDVAILQGVFDLLLQVMNPPLGPIGPSIPITGEYDSATAQAVRNIQSYFGLAVDGVAGQETYWVYGQGVGSHVTYGGPIYGSRQLSQGLSGGDVKVLQNRLNLFRYASFVGGPGNGIFGPKTAAAVAAFQQDAINNGDAGLTIDSIVGPATFDATWIYTFAGGRGILPGRNGFDVVFVQKLLQILGYYAGRLDGYYGPVSQAAVRAFQAAAGIAVDGQVGPQTFYQLGLRNAVAAPNPFPVFPLEFAPSECCVPLQNTGISPISAAIGSFFIAQSSSGSQLSATGISMLAPSAYNPAFTDYAFRLTIPGEPTVTQTMTLADSTIGLWTGGIVSSTLRLPNTTSIAVYPFGGGLTGPDVLTGNLTTCPGPG
ncbi:MAG: peptidoglycan-binding domain-containing protein [Bacillota bacterium]